MLLENRLCSECHKNFLKSEKSREKKLIKIQFNVENLTKL